MISKTLGVKQIFIGIICVIIILVSNTSTIMASGLYEASSHERSLLDDVDAVSDIKYTRARNGHLNYGFIELSKISATRARISATTQAHHVCPEIHMNIYLDQYDEKTGIWNQLRGWEYSTTDSQHLTKNMEIIVPSGHYYSIRGYHLCIHGNVMESAGTETDGLYIGILDKPIM